MSELKTLSVQKRSELGKGANRRLRVKALVPGVFYASDGTNVPVQMPALPLSKWPQQRTTTTPRIWSKRTARGTNSASK